MSNTTTSEPQTSGQVAGSRGSAEWEYIRVEVSRFESTDIYLKVPKGWRPTHRDSNMLGRAAKDTTRDDDWCKDGWELDVKIQSVNPVDAKEAETYLTFDALPHLSDKVCDGPIS